MFAGQQTDDPVLGAVGVLVLVHEDVAPEAAVPGERLRDLLEEPHRLQEQVVEVHGADRAQALLVTPEHQRDFLFPRSPRPALRVVDAEHVVLPGADALGDGAGGRGALAEVELLHALLDETLAIVLVVDDEVGRQPDVADRKSTRLNSSHLVISYAVFCLKKKKKKASTILVLYC